MGLISKIANGHQLAFDRSSVRTFDKDGHLHVKEANISKATVNPYYGREIPDYDKLGLDPNKQYDLYRDPEELERAADTFNGKPLLFQHKPTNAQDHAKELVVGALSNVRYEHPHLKARIVVWPGEAIDAIESDEQKELSSGYHYRADMTPGKTREGQAYDGVMRDIVGNHVALVKEGRAGPDVVIGDSMENFMKIKAALSRKAAVAQGALMVYLKPKLAMDAKIDLAPVLRGVNARNYSSKKAKIAEDLKLLTKDKMSKDANTDDLAQLLDALEEVVPVEVDNGGDPPQITPDTTTDADPEALRAFLSGKISDEDLAKALSLAGNGAPVVGDEDTDEDKAKREAEEEAARKRAQAQDQQMKNMVSKDEMKAEIEKATRLAADEATKTQREIREAERHVRPWVGELAIACDSAEGVYKAAFKALNVNVKDVHPSAFKTILELQPKPGDRKSSGEKPRQAMDQASTDDFYKRFPGTERIGTA